MTDPLEQLLKNADTTPPAGASTDGIAIRVRERRAAQQRVTASVVAVAILGSAVLLAVNWNRSNKPVAEAPVPKPVVVDELALRVHELTAERLLADKQISRPSNATNDPTISVQEQRDRAALILIYDAERYTKSNRPTDAIATYRRAIELFPQSTWAELARRRLREFESGMTQNTEENV